jgi:hypothetical protein
MPVLPRIRGQKCSEGGLARQDVPVFVRHPPDERALTKATKATKITGAFGYANFVIFVNLSSQIAQISQSRLLATGGDSYTLKKCLCPFPCSEFL